MKIKLLVIVALITVANCQDDEETEEEKMDRINTQWAFVLYDLTDFYDELSNAHKNFFLHTSTYTDKISAELKYSRYLRNQSQQMRQIEDAYDVPSEYQRMYHYLLKPNSAVLDDPELVKLTEFSNTIEEMSEGNYIEDPDNSTIVLYKQKYEDKLMTSRNISYLEAIWSDWQANVTSGDYNFTEILFLTGKITHLNGDYDSRKFWEEIVQYPDGFNNAKNIWDEIEPFYRKFHKFVLDRINNYYETNYTNIPVYLLGSRFGEDWSSLADIILPHQQIYHDAITSLNEFKSKNDIYQHCDKVAAALKFKRNGENFWKKSNFKMESCPVKIVSFCSDEYSIVLTCNKTSWVQYLDMQEKAFEIGLRNLEYNSLPYRSLRYSFLEEAVQSLGSTIAIHNLPHDKFVEMNAFTNHTNVTENLLTAKLLVALRVLPRLAYYYAADNWRLNELEYPTGDVVKSWWNERMKYQGVQGVSMEEIDFLEDDFIIRNKPYLGKFLGTVLQFSFLAPLEFASEETPSIVAQLIDRDFHEMVKDIALKDPIDIISWHYSLDEIPYYDIKSYFSPLEEYFESAPLEPYPFERRNLQRKAEAKRIDTTTTTHIVTEQTPKENISLAKKETKVETKVEMPEDVPQNDAPAQKATGHSIGMYILITIAACVLIMVALLVFKRLVKMRRPRTNNRRFQP